MNNTCLNSLALIGASTIFCFLVTACGGGSTGDADQSSSITYTGSTSQASLSETSSQNLAGNTYTNGETGSTLGTFSAMQASGEMTKVKPRGVVLIHAMQKAVAKADFSTANNGTNSASTTITHTETGVCGGTAEYNISFSDISLAFNGSMTFSSYCDEDGATINGSITFSGHVASPVPNPALADYTMFINALNINKAPYSFTADGSLTATIEGLKTTVNLDMCIKDSNAGATYWANNYLLIVTTDAAGAYEDFTMSGKFYAPTEGYVSFSTPVALQVMSGAACPTTTGRLTLTGKDNTSATLQVSSVGTCQYKLEIDTNGDGATDVTQTGPWSDL